MNHSEARQTNCSKNTTQQQKKEQEQAEEDKYKLKQEKNPLPFTANSKDR